MNSAGIIRDIEHRISGITTSTSLIAVPMKGISIFIDSLHRVETIIIYRVSLWCPAMALIGFCVAGEMGREVKINDKSLSPEEKAKYDTGWQQHAYNEYASNMISVRRHLPDYRNKL